MYAEELHAFCTGFVEFNPGSTDMFKCGLEHKWCLPKESKRVWSFSKMSQLIIRTRSQRGGIKDGDWCSKITWLNMYFNLFNLATIPNHKWPNWSYNYPLTFSFLRSWYVLSLSNSSISRQLYRMKLTTIVLIHGLGGVAD